MNPSAQNPFDRNSGSGGFPASGEFDTTLRLIASLPAPEGLAERVQAGLRVAPCAASGRKRIFAWLTAPRLDRGWLQSPLARSVAAAAIVFAVAGGGWFVSSHARPAQPSSAIAVPPQAAGQGGFSSAGAVRTPQTLNVPVVARPATVGTQTAKAAGKRVVQTPVRHGKPVQTKNSIAPTAR